MLLGHLVEDILLYITIIYYLVIDFKFPANIFKKNTW